MSEMCDVCGRVECHLPRSQDRIADLEERIRKGDRNFVAAEARITVLEDALREALEASSRGPLFGSDMERWSRVLRGEPPPAPEKP